MNVAHRLKALADTARAQVEARKAATPFSELEALVAQAEPPRNFFAAVTDHPDPFHVSIIVQVSRKDPIDPGEPYRPEFARDYRDARPGEPKNPATIDCALGAGSWPAPFYDPALIACSLYSNGAAAIAVATDESAGGSLAHIERIKETVPLPVLRYDIIVDPWQLWESRAAGADAVLLIAECLTLAEMIDLHILAQQLGLTVLLETRSMENVLRVRPHVGFPHKSYSLLGINNRPDDAPHSGKAGKNDGINHTIRLAEMVEDTTTLVSEFGVETYQHLLRLRKHHIRMAMVGDLIMREPDPGRALAKLLNRAYRPPDNPPTPPRGVSKR